jgi:hypothetical protein
MSAFEEPRVPDEFDRTAPLYVSYDVDFYVTLEPGWKQVPGGLFGQGSERRNDTVDAMFVPWGRVAYLQQ